MRVPQPTHPSRAFTWCWAFRILVLALSLASYLTTAAVGAETAPYDVPQADGAVVVDARLDETAWQTALVVELRYETFPGDNTEPAVRTEMLVTHDQSNLFVGFRAYGDPAEVRAHLSDRDKAWDDDIVGITIDTFNDGRRAFEFWSNPLGVQLDLFYDDIGDNEDSSWNAIWSSAGRITEEGFVVEMGIPFSSLRFPKTSGPQTWGFDGIRFYPREQDYSFRSQPRDRNISCYICQFSKMRGFAGISPGRNLELTPTVTGRRSDLRTLGADDFEDGDEDGDLGLTLSWGLTPNLNLGATINPDFSQVEADEAQLQVNTQFALFFPETRDFFLEGADFFDTPIDVVYTRVVADPDAGLKLTGKQGRHGIGVFAARDAVTNLLIPGSQRSRLATLDGASTDTVLRYRRDFGKRSALGVLVTDREGEDAYANRVGGFDGLLRVSDSDTVNFQLLGSQTRYPDAIVQDFAQPAGRFEDLAYRVGYSHNSRHWTAYARYEDIGRDFRADLGFLPQVDRRFILGGLERIFWGEKDRNWWTRIRVGGDWDLTEDQSGQLLERELEGWFNVSGPHQSFFMMGRGTRTRFFSGREFEEWFQHYRFEIEPSAKFNGGIFVRHGNNVDFANVRPGDQLLIEPWLSLRFGRRLKVDLEHDYDRLEVEGGELFTANLSELRLVYQINLRSFVRLITQYLDVDRNPALYNDPASVEAREQDLANQLLFSYKVNPRTVLFVGYGDTYGADDSVDLTQTGRTVFFKVGYAWVF